MAYRHPEQSKRARRAIEFLAQAQTFHDDYARAAIEAEQLEAAGATAQMLLNSSSHVVHRTKDDQTDMLVQHNQAAMWTSINDARALLAAEGYDVGAEVNEAGRLLPLWAEPSDRETPARELARLKGLLPHADFRIETDPAVEAYIQSQQGGKSPWWLWVVLPLAAAGAFVLFAVRSCA